MPILEKVKERWIEALRSGEYEQTQGSLRGYTEDSEDFSYCCLGVLTDLEIDRTGLQWIERSSSIVDGVAEDEDFSVQTIESEVVHEDLAKELGTDPDVPLDREVEFELGETIWKFPEGLPLYALNDGALHRGTRYPHLTFEQIADVVEDGIEGIDEDELENENS